MIKIIEDSRYDRLVIISELKSTHYKNKKHRKVVCECDCGELAIVNFNHLLSKTVRSCGCSLDRSLGIEGGSLKKKKRSLFLCWSKMIDGVKLHGIYICRDWYIFKNFCEDMDGKPPKTSLYAIDETKSYCKTNCIWLTKREYKSGIFQRTVEQEYQQPKSTPYLTNRQRRHQKLRQELLQKNYPHITLDTKHP